MVLIALVCSSTIQGQYVTTNTYSSSTSTPSSTSSAISQYAAVSQATGYLGGIVLSLRDENSMYVNFTNSNIPGIEGDTLILLSHPVSMKDLMYFRGKELSFSLLGHDILGRPVCDAYFDGIPIDRYLKQYERYENYAHGYGYYPPGYEYYPSGYEYYPSGYGYYPSGYEYYPSGYEYYPSGYGYYPPEYEYYSSGSLQIFEST
jgi:hypothetical protein